MQEAYRLRRYSQNRREEKWLTTIKKDEMNPRKHNCKGSKLHSEHSNFVINCHYLRDTNYVVIPIKVMGPESVLSKDI